MPAIVVKRACAKRYAIPADEVRRGDINVPGLIVSVICVLCCARLSLMTRHYLASSRRIQTQEFALDGNSI